MTYLVVCTFDLKDASSEDYQNAYEDLSRLGLDRSLISSPRDPVWQGRPAILPAMTTAGKSFKGRSAGAVRDAVTERVESTFRARGFEFEIFVLVSGDWAWSQRTTALMTEETYEQEE